MHAGVFDTADVLIHRHPVVIAFVDHGRIAVMRAIALEVPGAVDEGIHRIGFTLGIAAALRTFHFEEGFALRERIAGTVRNQVFGENDREIFFRHRNGTAAWAVDHRDRRTPVALTGHTPVAKTEFDFFLSQTATLQFGSDGVNRFMNIEAVKLSGIDQMRVKGFIAVPVLPGVVGIGFSFNSHDLLDGKTELFGKGKIAFVMSGHSHDSAFAVTHQDVIGNPDFNVSARNRVLDVKAGGLPLLFHRGNVRFGNGTLGTFFDKGLEIRTVFRQIRGQRMFGGDGHKRNPHQGIGAGGVDPEFFGFTV
ncbi:hypothetical protein EVA_08040 [gut metagenome]|uniref:Uncharacterized protein n=1 Tax=gut metagenome TaxID=749906 RepID=J9GAI3_9ZZZZ